MDDSEALLVNCINICTMFFEKDGKVDVPPEDCIVNASEAFIVFAVEPGLLAF